MSRLQKILCSQNIQKKLFQTNYLLTERNFISNFCSEEIKEEPTETNQEPTETEEAIPPHLGLKHSAHASLKTDVLHQDIAYKFMNEEEIQELIETKLKTNEHKWRNKASHPLWPTLTKEEAAKYAWWREGAEIPENPFDNHKLSNSITPIKPLSAEDVPPEGFKYPKALVKHKTFNKYHWRWLLPSPLPKKEGVYYPPDIFTVTRFPHKIKYPNKLQKNTQAPENRGWTVKSFLGVIGRDCAQYHELFESWEHFWKCNRNELKALEIPVRQRRWILRWQNKFLLGDEPYKIKFRSKAKKNKDKVGLKGVW